MLSRNMGAPERRPQASTKANRWVLRACAQRMSRKRWLRPAGSPGIREATRHDHVEYVAEGRRVSVGLAHPVLPSPPTPGIHRFTDAGLRRGVVRLPNHWATTVGMPGFGHGVVTLSSAAGSRIGESRRGLTVVTSGSSVVWLRSGLRVCRAGACRYLSDPGSERAI